MWLGGSRTQHSLHEDVGLSPALQCIVRTLCLSSTRKKKHLYQLRILVLNVHHKDYLDRNRLLKLS